jgi:hypothetical protein
MDMEIDADADIHSAGGCHDRKLEAPVKRTSVATMIIAATAMAFRRGADS